MSQFPQPQPPPPPPPPHALRKRRWTETRSTSTDSPEGGPASTSSASSAWPPESESSCSEFCVHSGLAEIDDELDFLFNGPTPPTPLPPRTATLDLFLAESTDSTVESSAAVPKQRRMQVEYRPLARSNSAAAAAAIAAASARVRRPPPPDASAQAVLHDINDLLRSVQQLSSETDLLSMQATRLVNDVLGCRATGRV